MGNYSAAWKKYATFSGRATRAEYWSFSLLNVVIAIVLEIPTLVASKDGQVSPLLALPFIFLLAIIVPSLAVTWRRLHDTGRSGGWYFISLVPFIGGIWLLVLLLLSGTPGPNEYGPDPKAAA